MCAITTKRALNLNENTLTTPNTILPHPKLPHRKPNIQSLIEVLYNYIFYAFLTRNWISLYKSAVLSAISEAGDYFNDMTSCQRQIQFLAVLSVLWPLNMAYIIISIGVYMWLATYTWSGAKSSIFFVTSKPLMLCSMTHDISMTHISMKPWQLLCVFILRGPNGLTTFCPERWCHHAVSISRNRRKLIKT